MLNGGESADNEVSNLVQDMQSVELEPQNVEEEQENRRASFNINEIEDRIGKVVVGCFIDHLHYCL